MKTYLALALACLVLPSIAAAASQSPQEPTSSGAGKSRQSKTQLATQRTRIEAVVKSYEQALNASDVEGVAQLFTDDAVLLAPNAPSAVGIRAVRAAYTGIFQTIDLDLTFEIAEVNVVSPTWAFLRSTSNGVVTVLANGAQIPSSNQELFVLHKSQGRWKLARYSFSSVLPSA
jgi:uncharacterized protein (TIGR02246 family)